MKKYILAILAYLSISFSSLIVEASAATGDNSYDGMGRIVLEKNMVNNVNTLTQDMFYKGETSHRVPNINTIFVIQYDFVLAEDITIPENCVLKFDGGSISGIYILKGNNTKIIGNGHIFNGCQFTGYFSIKEAKAEWFGVESSNTDNSSQINYALKFLRSTTVKILSFHTGRFNVKDVVTFGADNDGYSVNRSGWDFIIEGAGQGSSLPLSSGGGAWGTTFAISDFGCFFVNMLSEASGWGRSGVIRNCSFVGEKGTERGIIINQSFPFEISNCYFYGLGAAISLTGGAYYCNIFNCRFRSNDYCIKTLTSEEEYYNNNGANNNQVHNCTFQHNNYTIYLPVGGGWHIYDCDIEPENGEMYLFTDHEKVFGMVALVMHQDKAYETVPWEVIASNDQVATLRLLTICPEYRGQSLGNRLLDETIKIAAENGKKALRLDTLLSNTPAQHMYEKAGFSCRGTQHLFEESLGWTDFVFYEKVLESAN